MRRFRLGDVRVASDIVLSGLSEISPYIDADIVVRRGALATCHWVADPDGVDAVPDWAHVNYLRATDGSWRRIRYEYNGHFADFGIRADGREVTVDAGAEENDAELANLIEGPILCRALRLAGHPLLHASALTWEGRAIAFMGGSGAGKSSLAWALTQQGCGLLSDDMVGLTIGPASVMAHPGRLRLRLWPDVVERLSVDQSVTGALFPTTTEMEKFGVHDPATFEGEASPLHAIYRVRPRDPALAEPVIEETPQAERLADLAANLHGMILPDREGRRRELAQMAKVAAAVPMRLLTLPDDLGELPRIAADLKRRLFQ